MTACHVVCFERNLPGGWVPAMSHIFSQVIYDPEKVSYSQLLKYFWEKHAMSSAASCFRPPKLHNILLEAPRCWKAMTRSTQSDMLQMSMLRRTNTRNKKVYSSNREDSSRKCLCDFFLTCPARFTDTPWMRSQDKLLRAKRTCCPRF